jgi:hypothetical protein
VSVGVDVEEGLMVITLRKGSLRVTRWRRRRWCGGNLGGGDGVPQRGSRVEPWVGSHDGQ